LSLLVAFFPKCAVCWAAYMSLLGSAWLARAPFVSWLLPVLAGLCGVHLLLLVRKCRKKGPAPLLFSLGGVALILLGRSFFPLERWLLLCGVLLMLAGSLLNSFSADQVETPAPGAGEKARPS
jgi:hypothetical protein